MKPKEARRAAGRAEKPGGRRPDWPGLIRRLLGVVSGPLSPDLFCSPRPFEIILQIKSVEVRVRKKYNLIKSNL